jgi:xylose isomerase
MGNVKDGNVDQKLLDLDRFLKMAVDYKKKIGFKGTLLLELKPQEPTKHQYDWDVATTIGSLRKYGLEKDFGRKVECNHGPYSTLACTSPQV